MFVRSDTESAEDNSAPAAVEAPRNEAGEPIQSEDTTDTKEETGKRGPTVAARFSNFFAVVKKSVASKGSNTKDKYATQEQGEADTKVYINNIWTHLPWSPSDKEESLACQITSPFNNKLGCFENKIKNGLTNTTYLFVEWESYLASKWLPFI